MIQHYAAEAKLSSYGGLPKNQIGTLLCSNMEVRVVEW